MEMRIGATLTILLYTQIVHIMKETTSRTPTRTARRSRLRAFYKFDPSQANVLKRIASDAGATWRGLTGATPIAFAMRSESD